MKRLATLACLAGAWLALGAAAPPYAADPSAPGLTEAEELTPFGGRANFSPDGKRLVFVDKSYGNAFEIDLATRRVRNLTGGFAHQGIMRIQYLPSGDFLVTAPRILKGANTRAQLEMWVLRKDLSRGLEPLGEGVFEGIAVSRQRNLIAWTVVEPALKPGENWQLAFIRPTRRYVAEVEIGKRGPRLVGKREIMARLPDGCSFIEPQDFRDGDRELLHSCMGMARDGRILISTMGHILAEGRDVVRYRRDGVYAEVEGVAPDGSWTTVECGPQDKPGLPELDICRLELDGSGAMRVIVRGRSPGSTSDVSNPIVSPDGRLLVFQRSDSASGEIGEGYGLYMIRLDRQPAR